MIEEQTIIDVQASGILEKFNGNNTLPENLTEKIYIEQGKIVKIEYFENGQLTGVQHKSEGDT